MRLITTSWDDGHPYDFRLAELLKKYGIEGTFYIPKANDEREVMEESGVQELARHFEIGGHTINHRKINQRSEILFEKEIKGCFHWLEDLLGEKPISFCFPSGVYNQPAVQYTLQTGFKVIRTTELLNPGFGEPSAVVPTTLQVYRHSNVTYLKHLLKRFKFRSIGLFFQSGLNADLFHLIEFYLEYILKNGGCFHLWGHSWEIDDHDLWEGLERILKLISGIPEFDYVVNRDLTK